MKFALRRDGGGAGSHPSRVVRAGRGALRRSAAPVWILLQATIAAAAAWLIATHLVGNHEPFFAPIAAVVAISQPLGERGANALRLVLGVVVGILSGELAMVVFDADAFTLALATFMAMAVVRAFRGTRIMIIQAASGAILTVAAIASGSDPGLDRLVDALIGASVAVFLTQTVFSPEPVRLLRRAETVALREMAAGLGLAADGFDRGDDELGAQAIARMRDLRDRLAELGRLRRVGPRVARHSLVWRSQVAPVVHENENAGHLDLLGSSCLMFVRTALATDRSDREVLATIARELAAVLTELSGTLDDRSARQGAVDRSLAIAGGLTALDGTQDPTLAAALATARMLIADLMVFAGIDPGEAAAGVQRGARALHVRPPAPTPRTPFSGRSRPGR